MARICEHAGSTLRIISELGTAQNPHRPRRLGGQVLAPPGSSLSNHGYPEAELILLCRLLEENCDTLIKSYHDFHAVVKPSPSPQTCHCRLEDRQVCLELRDGTIARFSADHYPRLTSSTSFSLSLSTDPWIDPNFVPDPPAFILSHA